MSTQPTSPDETPAYALSLADEAATDAARTGGKGASLARLARAGLPVPEGFCVTTDAYRALADESLTALVTRLDGLDDDEGEEADARTELAAEIRDAVRERPLPESVREAIGDALSDRDEETPVVVRSSATAEDLPGASFAGQHETVANVSGEAAVVDAVRECMASLFTDRAVAYRARQGVPHGGVAMAVVVQRLVDSDASGILFTADPVSGHRRTSVIDAGFGLGEAQVDGAVTADTAMVDERTGEVRDYRVGEKRTAVRPDREGGTERVELPSEARRERVLTDDQARTLARYGERVEALFDGPQDVEWALADGRFWILQARPITTLFPVPEPAPEGDDLRVYYSFGHRQGMPDAMPPLVTDLWRRLTGEVTAKFDLPGQFGVEAGGRLYIDVTPYLSRPWLRDLLFDQLRRIDEPMAADLTELLSRRGDELPPPRSGPRFWLSAARTVASGIGPFVWQIAAGTVVGLTDSDPLAAPTRTRRFFEARTVSAVTRIRAQGAQATRVQRAYDEVVSSIEWILGEFFPFYAVLAAREGLERLCPGHEDDIEALVHGIETDVVTAMALELDDVAAVAREHPDVAAAVRAGDDYETIRGRDGGEAFDAAFQSFLDEYGARGVGEIDVSRPRYREDPTPLLRTIRGLLGPGSRDRGNGGDGGVEDTRESGHRDRIARLQREAGGARERLTTAADTGFAGPLRRRLVGHLADVYRGYFGIRELPKFGLVLLLDEVRRQVLAAGETLVSTGQLATVDDVWLLGYDELLDALEDPTATVDVERRRSEFRRYRRVEAPRFVTSDGEVPRVTAETAKPTGTDAPGSGDLVGTGVSAGVVEGTARVVTDPAETTLEAGEILVAPYVDPGWTPLFLNAAGLVTEVGGRLTHGSLVAREYGIPAVVAVGGATTRIESGQRIRVDGTSGTVELLD